MKRGESGRIGIGRALVVAGRLFRNGVLLFFRLGVEALRFVHPPAWPFNTDDNGMVNHTIHDRGGDDGIAQVTYISRTSWRILTIYVEYFMRARKEQTILKKKSIIV
ncbi:MAG: hypothetical protein Q8M56_10095 [Desulfobacterales bacterium]|nr:hypothetical protein [Desulfobacterales bacterium]